MIKIYAVELVRFVGCALFVATIWAGAAIATHSNAELLEFLGLR